MKPLPVKPILAESELFVDLNRTVSVEDIDRQRFHPAGKNRIGFGYAPRGIVWVKIELRNPYDYPIRKILEYADPLTTEVRLYDGRSKELLYRGGLSYRSILNSINPAFPLLLGPHETKIYYLEAFSSVTALNVDLELWNVDAFYRHEIRHQAFLAFFFGAMGILLLYNLFIYLSVRERVNLYYFLAFFGIVFHQFFYRGMAGLYLFTPEQVETIVRYAAFIVAFPVFFLALFTRSILKLKQYPRIDRLLVRSLYLFVAMTVLSYLFDFNSLRSLFAVLVLALLIVVTFYAFFHGNRQAKFLIIGWSLLVIPALLMYLSSQGIYDAFQSMPYLTELFILIETLLFSLVLADRMKELKNEIIVSQKRLIEYQREEERRLNARVQKKTIQLQNSLEEKDLLLRELNHRVKNSIQTIVSFLRLQIDEIDDAGMQGILINLENRILSISQLYALLYTRGNVSYIRAFEYFSLLAENIQSSLDRPDVDIEITTDCDLDSETAVYCGFIVNEAITNAFKYAFPDGKIGKVEIALEKIGTKEYRLRVADNGSGFDTSQERESLGLTIIQSLAIYQLSGEFSIDSSEEGTVIEVKWRG
nr:7TM diverse intracellular signaling domain-containing protein [Nitratifractor sp.]